MKMTPEEFGMWIAHNGTLHSAKINDDFETIVNEAQKELKDKSITVADVRAAAKAFAEAQRKAQAAATHGTSAVGAAAGKATT